MNVLVYPTYQNSSGEMVLVVPGVGTRNTVLEDGNSAGYAQHAIIQLRLRAAQYFTM